MNCADRCIGKIAAEGHSALYISLIVDVIVDSISGVRDESCRFAKTREKRREVAGRAAAVARAAQTARLLRAASRESTGRPLRGPEDAVPLQTQTL